MLSKHSSQKMFLTVILKAAVTRLELDMNMDFKHNIFNEHFQFSRPERSKEQNKSRGGRSLGSERKKRKQLVSVAQHMASYSTAFLLNSSSVKTAAINFAVTYIFLIHSQDAEAKLLSL